MFLIQQITNDSLQQQSIVLQDGSLVTIQMYFRPMQFGWFFNSITWGTSFNLKGIRIVNSPDLLYQWRNQIPFGLACYTVGNREPTQQEDFSSGASKLYLLTEEEVNQYREFLEGV